MSSRRCFVAAMGAAAAGASFDAFGQGAGKVYRIGLLAPDSFDPATSPALLAMLDGLRARGYAMGKNLQLESRSADGDYGRLPRLARELVELRPDVLVSVGTPAVTALKDATRTIPIVMVASGDAVATGLVASLASSGNNVTGATFFGKELMLKRLQLLRDAVPAMRRVAVLVNTANQTTESNMRAMNDSAKPLKIELAQFDVRGAGDVHPVFQAIRKSRAQALAVFEDAVLVANAKDIAALAAEQRLPSAGFVQLAEQGGLIGYGVNFLDLFRRAPYFIEKILKGESPSRIPVERPTTFDLVVNLKTARVLGIRLPQSILGAANRVIE